MSDKQPQDFNIEKPDFTSPASVLEFAGESFYRLFLQTRNEKAAGRARLLNNFIDAWGKIYSKYADSEGLADLRERLEALENEKGLNLKVVK